jgi:flagellar hook-basal body complex protein FliE
MIQNGLFASIQSVASPALKNAASAANKATPAEATDSFASFLKAALDSVAAQEKQVHTLNDKFLVGEADVNEVLIAASKAELSLSLTAQIRNKVVEAYQEIMRMQV